MSRRRRRSRKSGIPTGFLGLLLLVGLLGSIGPVLVPIAVCAAALGVSAVAVRYFSAKAARRAAKEGGEARSLPQVSRLRSDQRVTVATAEVTLELNPVARTGETTRAESAASWIPAGQSVRVGPYAIPGGLLYVGTKLASVHRWRGADPALIDPTLLIDASSPDSAGATMSYWPSYSDITPRARAAYLQWLAGGRTAPDAYIGYVFLFFYGLERRLLVDLQGSPDQQGELDQILAEIRRLLTLYGSSGSFRGYASGLLDSLQFSQDKPAYDESPPLERMGFDLPASVRAASGQLAIEGKPLPADWAYSWFVCSPEASLRTPARRCPDEFRALFRIRYGQKFGDGLQLKPSKKKFSVRYHPASASFGSDVAIATDALPGVSNASSVMTKLQGIAEGCTEDLSAYSRWIGRSPDDRNSIEGLGLLPAELVNDGRRDSLTPLRSWLASKVGEQEQVVVDGREVLGFWPADASKLAKADAVAFTQLLGTLGYGIEPDVRFRGPSLNAEDPAVVFRLPEDSPMSPSSSYTAAVLLSDLSAMVAGADGQISSEETRIIEDQVRPGDLVPAERARLRAHFAWHIAARPSTAGLKKRIDALDDSQRRSIARYLVAVAGADGHFDPTEVAVLGKLYKLLGFSVTDAYSDIHAVSSSTSQPASEPVTVQVARTRTKGFAVPAAPDAHKEQANGPVKLNMKRIEATLAETKKVAALLTDIFTDEEPPLPTPQALPTAATALPGLDGRYASILQVLVERPSWTRAEFESLTAAHGVLPDGTLDTINEYSLDRCGDPVCEGDDPVAVNQSLAREMLA